MRFPCACRTPSFAPCASATHNARENDAHRAPLARKGPHAAFQRIRCTKQGSMREWESAARRRETGDWRSGSAGPLQGQGHWFKSGIAHHEIAGQVVPRPGLIRSRSDRDEALRATMRRTPCRDSVATTPSSPRPAFNGRGRRTEARGHRPNHRLQALASLREKEPEPLRPLSVRAPLGPSAPNRADRERRRPPPPTGTGWPRSRTECSGGSISRTARA